ncbi:tetratricopeptide repeat protein [Sphingomicrobium flavum]|uniref:tetratricopeptide repeat protein n=1 Tax=Sphingomicrobium flavum TaxID=1229164 RepID=UPI0021AD80BB|nr:hypothetical protein [Sphingomicrobium flavum]
MVPIIRTCSLIALAASLVAAPASAQDSLTSYVNARAAAAMGDYDRSAQLFSRAAAQDSAIAGQAMSAALRAGRFDLARKIAAASNSAALNMDGRLFLLADTLRAGRYDDALRQMSDDSATANIDFVVPFVRAWIDMKSSSADRRADAIRRVTGIGSDAPMSSYVGVQAAYLHITNKDIAAARPLIDAALEGAGGRQAGMRLGFADALAKAGDRKAALELLAGDDAILVDARKVLKKKRSLGLAVDDPATALSDLLLALAVDVNRGSNRDLPIALSQISRAAYPASGEAAIIAGLLLAADEQPDEALALFGSVSDKHPLGPQARDGEIQALIAAERFDQALTVAKANGSGPGSSARIGDVYAAMDRHDEAANAYGRERAGRLDDWTLLFLEGTQRHMAGNWADAEVLLRHALAAQPDQPILLNYLGYSMLEEGGDTAEASSLIEAAHKLQPDNASITDSLGWAQFKLGQYDLAVETLRKAAQGAVDNDIIHEHLGDALWKVQNPIEARFAWQTALTLTEEQDVRERLEAKIAWGLTPATTAP